MAHVTEVHAYVHILKELKEKKGWTKEEIFTQNEIRDIKSISDQLGEKTPENIVKINEKQFYVIEAKSKRSMLEQAITEAREDYADVINKSKLVQTVFITGIAGNEKEGYISTSQFLHNGKWETITENGAETTALLSKSEIEKILQNNDPHLKDVEISNEEFFKAAYEINGIFHENGIIKDARARYISAILLAISKKPDIDLNPNPIELVNAINTRVNSVLKKEKKEDFSRFIHIDMPSSEDNHVKLKTAIVKAVEILYGLNICGMMQSGKDLLGTFYETFLKYGNGAKDLGIVLTPRHITRFAAEVMDIQPNDLVLDPTCGTGGFLVAAFDEIKKKTNGVGKDFENFKTFGLYGIEEQDSILALALVNMIFRGDGKNNMIEGNCFVKWLNTKTKEGTAAAEYLSENDENRVSPITKVLMNPPFPKKKTDKKEYLFVEHALKQMDDGGLLFSVLPYACMIKGGKYKAWRLRLIKENTLLSVVTFPPELFQPVAGVRTVGIFIKKGIPQKDQKVLWLRTLHDGLKLKKGKRLLNDKEPNDLETIKELLKSFLKNPNIEIENEPEFQKVTLIDYNADDKKDELELCPEAYLDEKPITQNEMSERIEKLMRENIAFNIKFEKELSQVKTNDS